MQVIRRTDRDSDKIEISLLLDCIIFIILQGKSSTRVWKVDGAADDVEFGLGSKLIDIPKLYLWQWNKTFNQSGIFAISDILKSLF